MEELSLDESIALAVKGCGMDLYDIVTTKEHDKNIYRVSITSKNGVTLEDCSKVSKMISPLLDIHEPIHTEYNLEVSSPGIERKLKNKKHFQASIDENVKVKDHAMEIYQGKLIDANQETITVETEFGKESIAYEDILSASTYYKW